MISSSNSTLDGAEVSGGVVDQGLSGKYRHRIPPLQQCIGAFFALLACNEWALTTGIDQYICNGTILVHIVPGKFSHSITSNRPEPR